MRPDETPTQPPKGSDPLHLIRQKLILPMVLTIVLAASCGGGTLSRSFRVALASSAPLVNSLVVSGAIPQSKASAIIADFDAGAQCGLTLQNEFATSQTRADKLSASSRALTCFRAVINRRNFAAHPKVQNAANIAEGILASLVVFYSESGPIVASADASGSTVEPKAEKAFQARLDDQVAALKEAMKPQ